MWQVLVQVPFRKSWEWETIIRHWFSHSVARYCSSHTHDSRSRWLVGSSSSRRSGDWKKAHTRATRMRSPPERSLTFFCWAFASNPRGLSILETRSSAVSSLRKVSSWFTQARFSLYSGLSSFSMSPSRVVRHLRRVYSSSCELITVSIRLPLSGEVSISCMCNTEMCLGKPWSNSAPEAMALNRVDFPQPLWPKSACRLRGSRISSVCL
mmetsp:Transcript_16684/g.29933  ORF Transcript_16684/g.29933 Transcript_16684/m.29933 type:complete len:210 (+) Transcript_16684:1324-1953(+)